MKTQQPYIIFEITTDCNLNCRYCYNVWKMPLTYTSSPLMEEGDTQYSAHPKRILQDKKFNSYNQVMKTLKKLFGIADVHHVTMTGGEPFLAERFSEIVLFCRMKNKEITIISNGNAGTKEDYKQMLEMGVSLFEFPLHSNIPSIHDYLTTVKGSWEKSLNSIKSVLKSGCMVVPVIVITKANAHTVNDTILFLKELGLNQIMLNRFNIGGMGINEKENLLLSHKELKDVYKKANELGSKYDIFLTSNVCTPLCLLKPEDYPFIASSSCSANASTMPMTLDIYGNIRLCNHSPVVAGNIFKDNFENILSSDYVKSWSKIIPDYCNSCDKYYRCFGGCRAAAEQLGLSLENPDPVLLLL